MGGIFVTEKEGFERRVPTAQNRIERGFPGFVNLFCATFVPPEAYEHGSIFLQECLNDPCMKVQFMI